MAHEKNTNLANAAAELEKVADSHGVARANHISMLARYLVALDSEFTEMQRELNDLRKIKEEHSDDQSQGDEVQTGA